VCTITLEMISSIQYRKLEKRIQVLILIVMLCVAIFSVE